MGKYGSGVSMKDMMRMEMAEVKAVLNRSAVSPNDRKIVTGALKQAFYLYANCNALSCVFEDNIMAEDMELFNRAANPARNMEAVQRKLMETYPEEWEDEEWES